MEASNPVQLNDDEDSAGNVCDEDDDNDNVVDPSDNCPFVQNERQADSDGDRIGDVCDEDDDGDSVLDEEDTCPLIFDPDQSDKNGDGEGDLCEGSRSIEIHFSRGTAGCAWPASFHTLSLYLLGVGLWVLFAARRGRKGNGVR